MITCKVLMNLKAWLMKKNNIVDDCKLVSLNKMKNHAGNTTFIENNQDINFKVKRIYYLFDVPAGVSRGGHAHYELEQFLVAVSGSFKVTLDDGQKTKSFTLSDPNTALNIKPGIWRDLSNFSTESICLVLASEKYHESDYMRDKSHFMKYVKNEKNI